MSNCSIHTSMQKGSQAQNCRQFRVRCCTFFRIMTCKNQPMSNEILLFSFLRVCEFVSLLWFHVYLWKEGKEGNRRNPSLPIFLVFFFLAKGIEGCKVRFPFHFLPHRRKGMGRGTNSFLAPFSICHNRLSRYYVTIIFNIVC